MPYRRTRRKRIPRTLKRARRLFRRRRRLPYKRVWNAPHRFARMRESTDIDLTGSATEVIGCYQFRLSDIINASELSVLYDQYRIDYVELIFNWTPNDPIISPSSVGLNNAAMGPLMYYVKDYDDGTALTLTNLQQYSTIRTKRFNMQGNQVKIRIKPAVLQEVFRSSLTTAYVPKWSQKLDMSNADVPHYGLKWAISKQAFNMGKIRVDMKYHLTCFNQR